MPWILVFKVIDSTTESVIRDERKLSFEEESLKIMEQKYISKCDMMGWKLPQFNVTLSITYDPDKND
jgi:hypothetical protein